MVGTVAYPPTFGKTSDRVSGVYSITHGPSGKTYIGSSCRIFKRWYQHYLALEKGEHANLHFQRAWAKHGSAEFSWTIVEQCSAEVLVHREQFYIDSAPKDLSYNISPTAGSTRGYKRQWEMAEATRQRIGRANRSLTDSQVGEAGKMYQSGETITSIGNRYGVSRHTAGRAIRGRLKTVVGDAVTTVNARSHTSESRERMRASPAVRYANLEARGKLRIAHTGKRLSAEHRAKISAANKGRTTSDEWRAALSVAARGRVISADTRAKMSAGRKGISTPWSDARRAAFADAEFRARLSQAQRSGWAAKKASQKEGN